MSTWTRTSKAQQRIHKERSQPEERQKLGFLEKKKDYKLRAQDHEKKQNTLKALRQKALDKNPDEFYFHMINSKIEDGKHVEKKQESKTKEQRKLMKSQDLRYIQLKRSSELKKINRLKASLAGTFTGPTKHIIFKDEDDLESLVPTGNVDDSDLDEVSAEPPEGEKILLRERRKALKELEQRMKREKELRITEQKLQVQKHVLASKKAKKVVDETKEAPPVYKWTFHRKR